MCGPPGESPPQHHAHLHLHGSQHHAPGRRLQLQSHRPDGADGDTGSDPGETGDQLLEAKSCRMERSSNLLPPPPLPQAHQLSDGSSSSHVVSVVTRVLHVFVDALPHVPDHRRLPILSQLVTTLGPARFLWVLMLLLFKLHATQTASSTGEKASVAARHCGSCS